LGEESFTGEVIGEVFLIFLIVGGKGGVLREMS
jgi:hypothetical protein